MGLGDFGAWKTFSEFLVNNCWLNFDIGCPIYQNLLKNAKKGNCWLKTRGFFVVSCLQLWYLGEKWPKGCITTYENNYNRIYDSLENIDLSVFVIFINFKQFWPIWISNFIKHFIHKKTIAIVIWSFHDNPCNLYTLITPYDISQH